MDQEPSLWFEIENAVTDVNAMDKVIIDARDAKMHSLYSRVQKGNSHKDQLALQAELSRRMTIDHIFEEFAE